MRVNQAILCLAAILTLGRPLGAETPPPTYTVNLSRTEKVGDRYHLIARSTAVTDGVYSMARVKDKSRREEIIDLDGTVTVRKIDSHGQGTWLECLINKLRVSEGSFTRDILPPGTVLNTQMSPLAGAKYQRFVTIDQKQLEGDIAEMISRVFDAKMPDAPTEQEIFGSNSPQLIGSTWALNRQRGVQYWASLSMAVEPRDFSGKSRLIDIEKLGTVECFRIEGSMKATNYKSTVDARVKTERGSTSMKYTFIVPREKSLRRKSTIETHNDFSEKGVDDGGRGFRREMVEDITQEITIEPTK